MTVMGALSSFPLAQEEGLAAITFNPLAGGLLSGKYKHGDTPELSPSWQASRLGRQYTICGMCFSGRSAVMSDEDFDRR
jgi:aryl-alcohol dehydrogenase-like predicted oxidoreductase